MGGGVGVDSNRTPKSVPYGADEILGLRVEMMEALKFAKDVDDLKDIMRKYNIRGGKGFIPVKPDKGSKVLEEMKKKVDEEKLTSFKYIPYKTKNVPVCVYTSDFDDVKEIQEIERELRDCGITEPMYWKPDAYTYVGIYSGNGFQVKPHLYVSK